VLTQRFLSHLEPGNETLDLSSLVAITYTERAAREMRDRIRQACRDRLQQCPVEQAPHWLRLVRDIDTARISTIHSFCGSLLRSQAVEAGLDPRFSLLEETTGGAFLRNEVRAGLHELLIANDTDATSLAVEFGTDKAAAILELLIPQRFRLNFAEWLPLTSTELIARWQRQWREVTVPKVLRELVESENSQQILALLREHTSDNPKMRERRSVILRELPTLGEASNPADALNSILEQCYVKGSKASDWESEDIYEQLKSGLETLRKELKKILDDLGFDPEHVRLAAEFGLTALRVVNRLGDRYDQAKREAALLDFDDLLILTRNLLRDNLLVRRRIASGISLLMVDEFQDTDPLQTDIVRFLCGDRLTTGKLFLVGDAKQSIYRFRRAEPKVFHELRQEIPEPGRLPLSTNFRSQPEILNFVNVLFDGALGAEYEPLVPAVKQISPRPAIEFLFTSPPPEEEVDKASENEEPGTKGGQETAGVAGKRREAEWVARRVQSLLHDGVSRIRERDRQTNKVTLRPVQARDIVILFRAMSDVRYFEEALRKHHLDYYVVGGRAFYAQQEVFDLANLCQALDDPDDDISLVGVLRSPFFALHDDCLYALRQPNGSLSDALQQPPPEWLSEEHQDQLRFAARVWKELRHAKDRLSPAELLNLAISRTGYDASLLLEFLGSRKLANLSKLIDMARQFDRSGLFTLSDFVDRLREAVLEEAQEAPAALHPESSDVLRLMSIHQSKGLEFPVVIVADMDRKGNDRGSDAQLDPEFGPLLSLGEKFAVRRENLGLRMLQRREQSESLAETLRLLYVATTRAADLLILSAHLKQPGKFSHPWLKLLASRFDLDSGQVRTAPDARGYSPLLKYSRQIPQIHVHQEPPELVPVAKNNDDSNLSLSDLRETVLSAAPAAPPPLWGPLLPDPSAPRTFSISRLEGVDSGETPDVDPSPAQPIVLEIDQFTEMELDAGTAPALQKLKRGEADQLGTLVHAALERLDPRNPGDAGELIRRSMSGLSASPREVLREQATACVRTFLESRYFAEMRDSRRLFRELEWSVPLAGHTLTGKIDALYQTAAGEWVLLDFKTGAWPAATALTKFVRNYDFQLALYAAAIEKWLGKLPERVELVGLRGGLHRVNVPVDPRRVEQSLARAERAIQTLLGGLGRLPSVSSVAD
jgi:ATP-dependent helicase/nuclease subunit A